MSSPFFIERGYIMLYIDEKITAINHILSMVGAEPIEELIVNEDIEVANAVRILEKETKNVLAMGWDFNTVYQTVYPHVENNKIYLPTFEILYLKVLNDPQEHTYIVKDKCLYDSTENTDTFYTPLEIKMVRTVSFNELPHVFKAYITSRATKDFAMKYGNPALVPILQEEIQTAYIGLVDYDLYMSKRNMLELQGVQPILNRR